MLKDTTAVNSLLTVGLKLQKVKTSASSLSIVEFRQTALQLIQIGYLKGQILVKLSG